LNRTLALLNPAQAKPIGRSSRQSAQSPIDYPTESTTAIQTGDAIPPVP
jgi:hypothetical protein